MHILAIANKPARFESVLSRSVGVKKQTNAEAMVATIVFLQKRPIRKIAVVAYGYFNPRNRQVNFNANDPDNTNDNLRGRPSELVYLLVV